jgi:hypothetical protein
MRRFGPGVANLEVVVGHEREAPILRSETGIMHYPPMVIDQQYSTA